MAGRWPLSTFTNLYLRLSCKVSLTDTITNTVQLANAIGEQNLTNGDALMAGLQLSDVFPPPQPIGGLVHIIVRLPAPSCEFSPFQIPQLYMSELLVPPIFYICNCSPPPLIPFPSMELRPDLVYQFLDHQVSVSLCISCSF